MARKGIKYDAVTLHIFGSRDQNVEYLVRRSKMFDIRFQGPKLFTKICTWHKSIHHIIYEEIKYLLSHYRGMSQSLVICRRRALSVELRLTRKHAVGGSSRYHCNKRKKVVHISQKSDAFLAFWGSCYNR